jgi:C_GCAxxG_C_C family probable redox protein
MSLEEEAVKYFMDGYNCAESVLLAFLNSWSKYFRMGVTSAAASAFGGGMGRMGHVCGALSGGLIVIGLAVGRTEGKDDEGRKEAYSEAKRLFQSFQERWGALSCRELTGCDLSTREGFSKYRDLKIHETKCSEIVKDTVKTLTAILRERKRDP